MKTPRNPATVHPPLAAYTHQIELSGSERLLVLSGQVGMRPDGSLPGDVAEQLDVALGNVERNLEAADMDLGDLVKLTLYVVGALSAEARGVLTSRLGGHEPCMTLVFVVSLATPALLIELDAWASGS
jgi:2-iminobutanoate/2-iminopropanoate deaminase